MPHRILLTTALISFVPSLGRFAPQPLDVRSPGQVSSLVAYPAVALDDRAMISALTPTRSCLVDAAGKTVGVLVAGTIEPDAAVEVMALFDPDGSLPATCRAWIGRKNGWGCTAQELLRGGSIPGCLIATVRVPAHPMPCDWLWLGIGDDQQTLTRVGIDLRA